jgi:hypothetical protein
MSLITALLFAVSSVTTDGCLEGIHLLGPDTPLGSRVFLEAFDTWNWAFVGVYLLIGVPLYLYIVCLLAVRLMEYLSEERQRRALRERITEAEYRLMLQLGAFVCASCMYVCTCIAGICRPLRGRNPCVRVNVR